MIWVDGQILPDDGLTINAADRTFEHGLGLFETLRTWSGRAPLLEAHKARMLRSAGDLQIPLDPARLPDDCAVRMLLEAQGETGDRILRITATGGSQGVGTVVWMRSPHPIDGKTPPPSTIRVALDTWAMGHDDPLARHKSLNFWSRRLAHQSAVHRGFDETLGLLSQGVYCEGGWSNLFVVVGDQLLTPSLKAPIVPGITRRLVLDLAESLPLASKEVPGIPERQLLDADEVFLTNSVRGIMPVALAAGSDPDRSREWQAPGPWTLRLQAELADWIDRGESP
jgi:branched-chain amino acid aminotransferase